MLNIYIFKVLIALHRNPNEIYAIPIIIHVYEEQETGMVSCININEKRSSWHPPVKEATRSSLNMSLLPAASPIPPELGNE